MDNLFLYIHPSIINNLEQVSGFDLQALTASALVLPVATKYANKTPGFALIIDLSIVEGQYVYIFTLFLQKVLVMLQVLHCCHLILVLIVKL